MQMLGITRESGVVMAEPTKLATTSIKVGGKTIILAVKNGQTIVPSSLKFPTGKARFELSFPEQLGDPDQGAKYLVYNEAQNGYEPPTRSLLERILRPGDLFIDVGAHWGFFTMQAAAHPAGDVTVIAFEPDPTNQHSVEQHRQQRIARGGLRCVRSVWRRFRPGAARYQFVNDAQRSRRRS
jgi:hypothetical protein